MDLHVWARLDVNGAIQSVQSNCSQVPQTPDNHCTPTWPGVGPTFPGGGDLEGEKVVPYMEKKQLVQKLDSKVDEMATMVMRMADLTKRTAVQEKLIEEYGETIRRLRADNERLSQELRHYRGSDTSPSMLRRRPRVTDHDRSTTERKVVRNSQTSIKLVCSVETETNVTGEFDIATTATTSELEVDVNTGVKTYAYQKEEQPENDLSKPDHADDTEHKGPGVGVTAGIVRPSTLNIDLGQTADASVTSNLSQTEGFCCVDDDIPLKNGYSYVKKEVAFNSSSEKVEETAVAGDVAGLDEVDGALPVSMATPTHTTTPTVDPLAGCKYTRLGLTDAMGYLVFQGVIPSPSGISPVAEATQARVHPTTTQTAKLSPVLNSKQTHSFEKSPVDAIKTQQFSPTVGQCSYQEQEAVHMSVKELTGHYLEKDINEKSPPVQQHDKPEQPCPMFHQLHRAMPHYTDIDDSALDERPPVPTPRRRPYSDCAQQARDNQGTTAEDTALRRLSNEDVLSRRLSNDEGVVNRSQPTRSSSTRSLTDLHKPLDQLNLVLKDMRTTMEWNLGKRKLMADSNTCTVQKAEQQLVSTVKDIHAVYRTLIEKKGQKKVANYNLCILSDKVRHSYASKNMRVSEEFYSKCLDLIRSSARVKTP